MEKNAASRNAPGFGKSVEMLLEEAESIKARKETEKNARVEFSAHTEKKWI